MHCMKCGVKIEDRQVFCGTCLEDMEKHPVKPNSTVYLPPRAAAAPLKKKSRRIRELKPEEQLRRSKKTVFWLSLALAATLVALALTSVMLLHFLDQQGNNLGIGQNYGSMTDANR